jgi:hypothetical protein
MYTINRPSECASKFAILIVWSRISIFKTSYTSLISIWLFLLFSICLETKLEKTLSEKDKSNCDGEITVTECSDAVNEGFQMEIIKLHYSY